MYHFTVFVLPQKVHCPHCFLHSSLFAFCLPSHSSRHRLVAVYCFRWNRRLDFNRQSLRHSEDGLIRGQRQQTNDEKAGHARVRTRPQRECAWQQPVGGGDRPRMCCMYVGECIRTVLREVAIMTYFLSSPRRQVLWNNPKRNVNSKFLRPESLSAL